MSAFLRFTLFVAALCVALVVGYMAGIRNANRAASSDGRLTIDTGQSSGPSAARPDTGTVTPKPAAGAAQNIANAADAATATQAPDAPTSIDEILEKHASQPPPAE